MNCFTNYIFTLLFLLICSNQYSVGMELQYKALNKNNKNIDVFEYSRPRSCKKRSKHHNTIKKSKFMEPLKSKNLDTDGVSFETFFSDSKVSVEERYKSCMQNIEVSDKNCTQEMETVCERCIRTTAKGCANCICITAGIFALLFFAVIIETIDCRPVCHQPTKLGEMPHCATTCFEAGMINGVGSILQLVLQSL